MKTEPFSFVEELMTVSSLIQEFSPRTSVPVDVNDVIAALSARGIKDEVYFFPVAIDSEVLRGQLVHWDVERDFEYPTDAMQKEIRSVAAVFYATDLTDDWSRLVCCKELLHILDPEAWCARTEEDVELLTKKIVLPPEYQDGLNDGIATVSDRVAILQAVAVLFPLASREILMKALEAGQITLAEAARMVDLPQRYTNLVLSTHWDRIYKDLVSL